MSWGRRIPICLQQRHVSSFQSVALDSISEIAEVVLSYEKKMAKDPAKAYGATGPDG